MVEVPNVNNEDRLISAIKDLGMVCEKLTKSIEALQKEMFDWTDSVKNGSRS